MRGVPTRRHRRTAHMLLRTRWAHPIATDRDSLRAAGAAASAAYQDAGRYASEPPSEEEGQQDRRRGGGRVGPSEAVNPPREREPRPATSAVAPAYLDHVISTADSTAWDPHTG